MICTNGDEKLKFNLTSCFSFSRSSQRLVNSSSGGSSSVPPIDDTAKGGLA